MKNTLIALFLPVLYLLPARAGAQAGSYQPAIPQSNSSDRWKILPDGSIEWRIDGNTEWRTNDGLPHSDHIEMSGQKVSLWVQYGVGTDGRPVLNRTLVFPTVRLLPVNTTASMMYNVVRNCPTTRSVSV